MARDIVSGSVDVDKMDYLQRDSYFWGSIPPIRHDKLIESARLHEVDGNTYTFLAFSADGVYVLEALLLARYQMHRQVYGHPTRVASDKMLTRSIVLVLPKVYCPTGLPPEVFHAGFVEEYIESDDARLVTC